MIKGLGRRLLRLWGRLGSVPGYHYQAVEKFGALAGGPIPVPTVLPNGCRMECDLADHVMRQIYYLGAYEPVESYLFMRLLKPGMIVIDAGANVGQYTLLAATAVGEAGEVHSFEPEPANFARLQKHVADNRLSNVHLARGALWNEDGVLNLGMPSGIIGNAGAYRVHPGSENPSTARIEGLRLDAYAARKGLARVDFIKMDIEGAEPFAISGADALIRKSHPLLLLEVNREALLSLGSSPDELWGLMSRHGYRAFTIGESASTCHEEPDLEGMTQGNVLFHAGDLPSDIIQGWTLRDALRWARQRW